MKRSFSSWYRPDRTAMRELWERAVFSFDANVLLDLYRFTPETQKSLLAIISKIKDRIWLPHQAGLEFHRNRVDVIADMLRPYKEIRRVVEHHAKEALDELAQFSSKHPFIRIDEVRKIVDNARLGTEKLLDNAAGKHPKLLDDPENDDVRNTLDELFGGKVGPRYADAQLNEIYEKAKARFERKIPPGYMDAKEKPVPRAYGDVVLWFQMIDFARERKVPIIFVTGDTKEDWWLIQSGRTIGPRPELREEFVAATGQPFYMYAPEQFMKVSGEFIEVKTEKKAIDEVQKVRAEKADFLREALLKRFETRQISEASITEALRRAMEPPDIEQLQRQQAVESLRKYDQAFTSNISRALERHLKEEREKIKIGEKIEKIFSQLEAETSSEEAATDSKSRETVLKKPDVPEE